MVQRGPADRPAGTAADKMNMHLSISLESGFLNVVATGKFSLSEAKHTFLQMLDAVVQHKCVKVLFDGRGLTGKPDRMERFYYGEFVARAVTEYRDRGVSTGTQFAYVLSEPVLDSGRFGETVACNRGMYVKAFDNHAEALRWLGITPAGRDDAGVA